ncbi:MAG: hypothetical protein IJT81_00560 [Lachnospiraceae bacterium]|nr:hypothetical protein [Lachnospiraceae bacterium]
MPVKMLKKMAKSLTANIGLKLLAVLFAVIIWIVVVNIQNPQTTVSFTTTATIINSEIITDRNQVFEVKDNTDVIKFEVTGPRTIVKGMTASDFSVIADMDNFIWNNGVVAVTVSPLKYKNDVTIKVINPNIKIIVEELVTRQFAVVTSATGTPKTGYAEGDVTCYPGTVTITGPASLMESIDKVIATIDIDGMYDDRTQSIRPQLFNADGDKIESKNITIEPSLVEVTAVILETKVVPVVIDYFGDVMDGYALDSLSVLPQMVTIKGKRKDLQDIVKIELPAEILDLSNKNATYELPVNLEEYLPEGVWLVDPDQSNCVIRAEIAQKITKTIEIPVSYITLFNLGDDLTLEYRQTTVTVTVSGSERVVSNLDSGDFMLSLDLEGISVGPFSLKPTCRPIEGVTDIEVSVVNGVIRTLNTPDDGDE